MTRPARHIHPLGPVLALLALAGCARDDEAVQRARLAAWFALAQTVEFAARSDCAAGLYEVVDDRVRAAMPLSDDVAGMRRALAARGHAALRRDDLAPDQAIIAMAGHHRATGMAMRLAGFEARPCMGQATQEAFRRALVAPGTVLAWDGARGALMLLDPQNAVLVVAMGTG